MIPQPAKNAVHGASLGVRSAVARSGPYPCVNSTTNLLEAFSVLTLVADAHPVCSSGDDERKYYKF